jgi:hypothetical protein
MTASTDCVPGKGRGTLVQGDSKVLTSGVAIFAAPNLYLFAGWIRGGRLTEGGGVSR